MNNRKGQFGTKGGGGSFAPVEPPGSASGTPWAAF